MLVAASQDNPQLLPRPLWDEVHAAIPTPPFLVWATNSEVQTSFRKALAEAVFGPAPAEVKPAPGPTKDLPIIVMDLVLPNLGARGSPSAQGRGESTSAIQRARALGLPPVAVDSLRETADGGGGP